MTAHADAGTGVEAMRNGAFEYVTKPFEMDEMVLLIRSALEKDVTAERWTGLDRTLRAMAPATSFALYAGLRF